MAEHYITQVQKDQIPFDAETLLDVLANENDETVLVNVLRDWNAKGITEDEIYDLVSIMRRRMRRIDARHATVVDVVGTGGSRAKTFNVSTAAAFVIAGAGVPVAKHGNRAATSQAGSADVLTALGINIETDPATTARCLNDLGVCFMFAPNLHSLPPTLASARRALREPTIFNILGPLCNPASASCQIIGVWDPHLLQRAANVLVRLGTRRTWVVHGENGLDEISLSGKTHVLDVAESTITRFEIDAANFGIDPHGGVLPRGLSPADSSRLIREIFGNEHKDQSVEQIVLVNAAAAIFIAGFAFDLREGYRLAEISLRSGSAMEKMRALAEATKR